MVDVLKDVPSFVGYSPFKEYPSPFLHGSIVAVDVERWTVVVQLHETGIRQYNVPMLSPYFFRERGQGAYFIPEVGAQCLVCNAYGQYFILGYLPPVDPESSVGAEVTDNLSNQAGTTTQSSENNEIISSYRNNRDGDMLPGDYCLMTRARNRIKMFTNGNILVEATKLCMRLYSKLRNWVTDLCVNYTMMTPGGKIEFTNDEETQATNYRREVKQKVDDDNPSFVETVGDGAGVYKRVIQTTAGTVKYTEHIDEDGNVTLEAEGNMTIKVTGDVTIETAGGTLEMAAAGSSWAATGDLTITSTGTLKLDGSAIEIG